MKPKTLKIKVNKNGEMEDFESGGEAYEAGDLDDLIAKLKGEGYENVKTIVPVK